MLRDALALGPLLAVGDQVQVSIDCDEAGLQWAAGTVRSVDPQSGDFSVWVTEWDGIDKSDPAYEPAYEEGPFTEQEEGEEWRWPQPKWKADAAATEVPAPASAGPEEVPAQEPAAGAEAVPPNAVVLDAAKHAAYDYEAEYAAAEAVAAAAAGLTRAGFDKADEARWPALASAVETLYQAMEDSPAPPIAADPRLVGDWECVGCCSPELAARRGLTGLGAAPFTKLAALFFSFAPGGEVVAREILEFFGNPVIVNELRGAFGFSEDGASMQERYLEADIAGQQKSAAFQGATATLTDCRISADGTVRLGRNAGGVLLFKKLQPEQLGAYLAAKRLPTEGGTFIGNPSWGGPM